MAKRNGIGMKVVKPGGDVAVPNLAVDRGRGDPVIFRALSVR